MSIEVEPTNSREILEDLVRGKEGISLDEQEELLAQGGFKASAWTNIIRYVAAETEIPVPEVKKIVRSFLRNTLLYVIKVGDVPIYGFGTFKQRRPKRSGYNLNTKRVEEVKKPTNSVGFKLSRSVEEDPMTLLEVRKHILTVNQNIPEEGNSYD